MARVRSGFARNDNNNYLYLGNKNVKDLQREELNAAIAKWQKNGGVIEILPGCCSKPARPVARPAGAKAVKGSGVAGDS